MLDRFAASTAPDVSFKWTGERYQADCRYVDRSDFHYYLMTVKAAVPETGLPMSEDWAVDGLYETNPMTVQEFLESDDGYKWWESYVEQVAKTRDLQRGMDDYNLKLLEKNTAPSFQFNVFRLFWQSDGLRTSTMSTG